MSKNRTITGFGPAKITIASTTITSTTSWLKFGPFSGPTLTGAAKFYDSATSQSIRIDVAFTTDSTSHYVKSIMPFGDLTSGSGSSFGPKRSSGAAANYCYVRAVSTELSIMSSARKGEVWLVAGNPSS